MVSVILCSHNPRHGTLCRVLKGLRSQTLSTKDWEFLLIDNASKCSLSRIYDLSWHPQGYHLREERLGLTPARLRGIGEARGDILVFVDDDLVLDSNYLSIAKQLLEERENIGAAGGQISGEFEGSVPEWVKAYFPFLAINEWGDTEAWTMSKNAKNTIPCGAGLVIRAQIAALYASRCIKSARKTLGRRGKELSGSEDTDMIFTAIEKGFYVGYFPALKSKHVIPSERLKLSYIARLRRAGARSRFLLDFMNKDLSVHYLRYFWVKDFCYVLLNFSVKSPQHIWIALHECLGRLEGRRDALRLVNVESENMNHE